MGGALLAGLAAALGGGIRGYGEAQQINFRNKLMEEESRQRAEYNRLIAEERRRANERQEDEATARMAERGVFRGQAPTGKMALGVLGDSVVPRFEIDNTKRFTQISPDLYQDFTLSGAGRAISERQAKAKERSDANFETRRGQQELASFIQQGFRGDDAARAQARARGFSGAFEQNPVVGSEPWREAERFKTNEAIRQGRALAEARGGGGGGRALPSTMAAKLAAYEGILSSAGGADEALSGAMKEGVNTTGFFLGRASPVLRGLGRLNPKAVSAQAALANVSSEIMKQRSGGAVTPQEFERLEPFLPSKNEDEAVALQKLRDLTQYLKEQDEALLRTLEDSGYDVSRIRARRGQTSPSKYPENPF